MDDEMPPLTMISAAHDLLKAANLQKSRESLPQNLPGLPMWRLPAGKKATSERWPIIAVQHYVSGSVWL